MKTTILLTAFLGFIIAIHLKVENGKLQAELKSLIDQTETINYLKTEIYIKDSLTMNGDIFFRNQKEFSNFKKFYFNR